MRRPVLILLAAFALVAPARAQAGYGGGTHHAGVARPTVQYLYYSVEGLSEADLLQAMLRDGPEWEGQRFFGLTTSEVRYGYWKTLTATGCDLADVVVTSAITVTLPRWRPQPGTPYALEQAWRQFERALRHHEDGHRRMLEEEAEQIRLALVGLRTPACDTIDAVARERVERVRQGYAALHRSYDARTEHGRTQGAQWPLGR
jgi:predicted secreted Zn-dependent protease